MRKVGGAICLATTVQRVGGECMPFVAPRTLGCMGYWACVILAGN
jgi:hypothetical protein